MKKITKKLLAVLLTLCMALPLVPGKAQAAGPAAETADFTADDGGVAALGLLNAAKTDGAVDSAWDNSTRTLTLNGIDFTTTATTAVKLPAGTTVILTDGTDNRITGGGADVAEDQGSSNSIYVYGIYAEGALTIDGAGALSVTSGKHTNNGGAWTYSVGIYGMGNLTVTGGTITAAGGEASGHNGGFSYGVQLGNGGNLSVTGGTLTGIGGRSLNTNDPDNPWKTSSYGVYVYNANISVSGSGKLEGRCDSFMDNEEMARGIYTCLGDLSVSDSAQVAAIATNPIIIEGGSIYLAGGNIVATCTGEGRCAVSVTKSDARGDGNIEVSGGTLDAANGYVDFYVPDSTEQQGMFTITGGTVKTGWVSRVKKFNISGGTVQTQRISGNNLTLSNVFLTVREPVKKAYNNSLYVEPALWIENLTVNSGVLDVAWDWGENTPTTATDIDGHTVPLVRMDTDARVAVFNGGTTILNAGYAGNTALKLDGKLVLGDGVVETGADTSHKQLSSDVPVQFAAVAKVNTINEATISNAKFDYRPGDAPQKTAAVALPEDADKYEIEYEYWEEMQKNDDGSVTPAAFWYSDENKNSALAADKKITAFEEGKSYMYSIQLKAKDGYAFADGCAVKINDTAINATNITNSQNGLFVVAVKTIKPSPATPTPTPAVPTPTPTPTPASDYKIIEGANSAWSQNSDGTLTFRADGDFAKFTGVKVDGNPVPADQYTAVAGSTIVTFSAEYLKTLSAGAHTLTVVFNDGECSTNFEVTVAQNGNGGNTNPGNTENTGSSTPAPTQSGSENAAVEKAPKTGDDGNNVLPLSVLLLVCGSALAAVAAVGKRKKSVTEGK